MRAKEFLDETLKKVKGKWALVSKTTGKPLQYYHGSGHPSDEWVSKVERRIHSFETTVKEGGWASTLTQGTHITPALVDNVVHSLPALQQSLNAFLKTKDLPPVKIGTPVGSTTYYKRDLENNPSREYGDIDVNFFVPRLPDMSDSANEGTYSAAIKEFCDATPNYSTNNGTNVIIKVGDEYVQVDFVTSYYENEKWSRALGPEYNVKGVLSASLTSALAEALTLSFSGRGVQVKLQNGIPVSFKQSRDTELKTITNNPHTWAIDIAKFLGAKTISPRLAKYPGMGDEIQTQNTINSIIGIAESLNKPELIDQVKEIYISKINKAINNSKFDKAETPEAKKKAEDTKALLAREAKRILGQFNAS